MRERCRCKRQLELDSIIGGSREEVRAAMAARIAASPADAFAVVDAPTSPYALALGLTYDRMIGIMDALATQDRYVRVAVHAVPTFGAEASVWRRRDAATAPTGGP